MTLFETTHDIEWAFSGMMFNVDDAAAALRDYAAQGYQLVIGHGSQYGSSMRKSHRIFQKPVLPGEPPLKPLDNPIFTLTKLPPMRAVM